MCSQTDDPSTYDESLGEPDVSPDERRYGIPTRRYLMDREADRLHHGQARRSSEYADWSQVPGTREYLAERGRRFLFEPEVFGMSPDELEAYRRGDDMFGAPEATVA